MLGRSKEVSYALAECIHICNECFNACLNEDDVKMMTECIKLDKECSAICAATLGLIYKDAHFMKEMLTLCEKACNACAEECGKHSYDHCKECAKACKECAKACREFMEKM